MLKHRYGITEDLVNKLILDQGAICPICLGAWVAHVDHDHVTGQIRGLLCFKCNGALGKFQDDVVKLRRAIEYLAEHGYG
jgi:hypothetical protein